MVLPDKTARGLLLLVYLLLWILLGLGILAALAGTVFLALILARSLPEPLGELAWADWQVFGPIWMLAVTGCVLLGQGVRLLRLVLRGTPFSKKGVSALCWMTLCLVWAGVWALMPFSRLTGDPFLGLGLGWLLAMLFWTLAAVTGVACTEYRHGLEWNMTTDEEILL